MPPTAPQPFDLPEDITGLTSKELDDLEGKAQDAFDALYGKDPADLSDADVAELERLTGDVERIRGQRTANEQAVTERAEKISGLAGRVRPPDATTETPGEGGDGDTPPADAPPADAPPADAPPAETPGKTAEEDDEDAKLPEAVAASAAVTRPTVGSLVRTRPQGERDKPKARPKFEGRATILATAGGSPGFVPGSKMSLDDVGAAAAAAFDSFPQPGSPGRVGTTIARVELPTQDGLIATGGMDVDIAELLDRAADESALPDGSLLATGGWCAPSETLYDLFDEGASADGMLSTPELTVTRGGVRHTPGPQFCDIYGLGGFAITEAQDIAGATKPCFAVTCPAFVEERLEAHGLCLTAGILQSKGYPELVRKFTDGALAAHGHRINAQKIAAIVAGSTAVAPATLGAATGATAEVLSAVELAIIDYRTKHRMALEATLEVVMPQWADGLFRADLARQAAVTDYNVTDAQIEAWFSLRGASVQWVYDWQDASCGAGGVRAFGGTTAAQQYPATLSFLVYKAGTWVRGTSSIITLEAVYDSARFTTNDFTALFTEEGFLMAKRGTDSRIYTLPICPSGARANGVASVCA